MVSLAGGPSDDRSGPVFDRRYRVNDLIGSGGMGSVFRATHLEMNREVALKVLDHGIAESDKQVQRFYHEARASSRLQHPNTIRVFDFGKADDGRLFLAMELLKGETLAELAKREKRLPVARVCHILRQVCKSLAEAHQMGIIHRDLKPDNIFITEIFGEKDFVKVLDFGIAKSTEGPEQEALTQTGFICGTPRYLSPEQAMGRPVDPRSDLYAVGVLIYELLLGVPLFAAATPIAIVMRHIREEAPRLQSDGSAAGDAMSALVASLLEKTPNKRPANAGIVGDALGAIALGQGIVLPASPTTSPVLPAVPFPGIVVPLSGPKVPFDDPAAPADNATLMLAGPSAEAAMASPPAPSAPDVLEDVRTRVLAKSFPEIAPAPPPALSEDSDDFDPTLARGLPPLVRPPLPALHLQRPAARATPADTGSQDTRTPSEQKKNSGLVHRPKSATMAGADVGKAVAALSMVPVARRLPTEEIELPRGPGPGVWIGFGSVVVVVLAVLYFVWGR